MEKLFLKEAVVVEGRDDEAAVQRAVESAVLSTHGWGFPPEAIERIQRAYETHGIVILTDPDHAGERIRKRLTERFPEAKQAYLNRPDAEKEKGGRIVDVGVENASPEAIQEALLSARAQKKGAADGQGKADAVTAAQLAELGLVGSAEGAALRAAVGKALGIGNCNAKTFCRRLAAFGISREELLAAWSRISQENR